MSPTYRNIYSTHCVEKGIALRIAMVEKKKEKKTFDVP